MKKKQKVMETTKKERRKKFNPRKWANKWLDHDPLPQVVSVPVDIGGGKKPKVCNVCHKKGFFSFTMPEDNQIYCENCTKYIGSSNQERRNLVIFQNPSKEDFDKWYELKLQFRKFINKMNDKKRN